jgi:pentatricopeptide repeat protein
LETNETTECAMPEPESHQYVKDVLEVLRSVNHKTEMHIRLAPFVGKLLARDVTVVFKMMYNRQVAVDFYKWVKAQPGFKPNLDLYLAFAHCFLRVQKWIALEILVDEMIENKFPPDARLYAQIMKAASDIGRVHTVEIWFHKMRDHGCPFDLVIFNTLIAAYGKAGHYDQSFTSFLQLKKEGFRPDGATYSAILSACRTAGKVDMGIEIFKEMTSSGFKPDQAAYSILIDIFGKAQRPDEASTTFQQMQVLSPKAFCSHVFIVTRHVCVVNFKVWLFKLLLHNHTVSRCEKCPEFLVSVLGLGGAGSRYFARPSCIQHFDSCICKCGNGGSSHSGISGSSPGRLFTRPCNFLHHDPAVCKGKDVRTSPPCPEDDEGMWIPVK